MTAVSPATRKHTERLLNLILALRSNTGWLDRDAIRQAISDYRTLSDAAFDKAFTRDKEQLRAVGIHISTRDWTDPEDGTVTYGYRIADDDYRLDAIELTRDEAMLISVAGALVSGMQGRGPVARAVTKLAGLGSFHLDSNEINLAAQPLSDKHLGVLITAIDERRPVTFLYRKPGGEDEQRTLDPYAVTVSGERSYVVGRDHDRQAIRVFRLSRIQGAIRNAKGYRPGSFTVPEGFDAAGHFERFSDQENQLATLQAAPGTAAALRVQAVAEEGDSFSIRYADEDRFVRELLSLGSAVSVLEPDSLRSAYEQAREATRTRLAALSAGVK